MRNGRRMAVAVMVVLWAGAARGEDNAPGPAEAKSCPAEAPCAVTAWPPGFLMKCFEATPIGAPLDNAGIRVWGFLEGGATFNLSHQEKTLFGRWFDARHVGDPRLHQLRVTVERPYDPAKPFDGAFRVDTLYGGDAMLTHAAGMLERAGRGTGDNWFDVLQLYAQGWFKTGPDSGLEVTAGKFWPSVGFESTDACCDILYSHGLLADFVVPTTTTGAKLNYVFNKQFAAYVGAIEGWDVWRDNNHAMSGIAGLAFTGTAQVENHTCNQFWLNFIAGPEQPHSVHHNRFIADAVWTHYWTGSLYSTLNAHYGQEHDAGGVALAKWYGAAHYLTYVFNDRVSATWRAEWFHDSAGARIGAAGNFYENTLGLTLTPWPSRPTLKNVSLLPEVRWDHSSEPVFADHHDRVTAALAVVVKF